jgi:hypothetical protein
LIFILTLHFLIPLPDGKNHFKGPWFLVACGKRYGGELIGMKMEQLLNPYGKPWI